MNLKRLLLATIAALGYLTVTDFLIHGLWLMPDYRATAAIWRPDPEMEARMTWLFVGHLLCAATFVWIWAKGFASSGGMRCAAAYGFFMGLFSQVSTLAMYVVSPIPGEIAVKWFCSGTAQAVLLGLLTFLVYKPRVGFSPS